MSEIPTFANGDPHTRYADPYLADLTPDDRWQVACYGFGEPDNGDGPPVDWAEFHAKFRAAYSAAPEPSAG